MKEINVSTKRGSVLNGVLFGVPNADTVVIAITGIHGNFYSNPFYYNFGNTLNEDHIDFIYAQTNDAFGRIQTYNTNTGKKETIGSWNERFNYTDEDIEAYLDYAEDVGYKHIILAGHSLGANKVIYYLSRHHDKRVEHFIFLSPANLSHMMSHVTDHEKELIRKQVELGDGNKMLPFFFMGWVECIAYTAYDWLFTTTLNNVHVEENGDFSALSKITHTGAMLIGTYDNFAGGDPVGFLQNINNHMQTAKENKLIYIEKTGHTYQQKHQETADALLNLIKEWKNKMKKIFDQAMLGSLKLKNRMIRSATWEALADRSGHINEALYSVYRELAAGGVGAIISGFTSVSDQDHYFSGMVRLSNDNLIIQHQKLTDIVHQYNCPIIVQLAMGEYNRETYRNMNIDDLTNADIKTIISMFVDASDRAIKAGYDGVQIHAAHGFFLSRFISPAYNHRTDEYGGSSANRGRIVVAILRGIKKKHPDLHVTMKINCSAFIQGGLTMEDSMTICKLCADAEIDSIEVSGNGTSAANIRAGENEAYFKDFASQLADSVGIPVILVGGHRSIKNMEKVLNESNTEFLSLSRPLIREPNLPNRWLSGDTSPAKCISCNMCYRTPGHVCVFNQ